jgi:hypothetical protein
MQFEDAAAFHEGLMLGSMDRGDGFLESSG